MMSVCLPLINNQIMLAILADFKHSMLFITHAYMIKETSDNKLRQYFSSSSVHTLHPSALLA